MDVFDWTALYEGAQALVVLLGIDPCSCYVRKSPYCGVEIVLGNHTYITYVGSFAYINIKPQYIGITEGNWYQQSDGKWFLDLT